MPFVFLIFGILFLVVAVRGTQNTVFGLLKSEFSGTKSFPVFIAAIAVLGAVGYVKPLRPAADMLIGLVLLVMVLNNKGFFAQLNQAISNPTAVNPPTTSSGTGSVLPDPFGTTNPEVQHQQGAGVPEVQTPNLPGFQGLPDVLPIPGL